MDVSRGEEASRAISCCAGMRTRTILLVALALAVARDAARRGARQSGTIARSRTEYEEELAPNGYWVDEPQFGHVWRPYVGWGWRPDVDGHWKLTRRTDGRGSRREPRGAGRSTTAAGAGRTFTGGCGRPATSGDPRGSTGIGATASSDGFHSGRRASSSSPGYWTYVHDYRFCAPRMTNVVVVHDHLPPYVFSHREHGWGRARPPDIRDIDLVSRHRVERVSDRPRDSIAPWVTRTASSAASGCASGSRDRGEEHIVEHPGRGATMSRMDDRGQAKGRHRPRRLDRRRVTDAALATIGTIRGSTTARWRRRDGGGRRMGGHAFD